MINKIILFMVFMFFPWVSSAAPKADLWPLWSVSDETSQLTVSNQKWAKFLQRYVSIDWDNNHLVDYGRVSAEDHRLLKSYIATLESLDPRRLKRDEQFAYWVNLYNAVTVDLILDHYPIASITKLGGFFSFGPWDEKIINVDGNVMSLNDIEHRILRPIWKDSRIHYAVNCASFGCPNLHIEPYDAASLEPQLDHAAKAFINSDKGVLLTRNQLVLSEIYNWYRVDFGTSEQLESHLKKYLSAVNRETFKLTDSIEYRYNWSLNDAGKQ